MLFVFLAGLVTGVVLTWLGLRLVLQHVGKRYGGFTWTPD